MKIALPYRGGMSRVIVMSLMLMPLLQCNIQKTNNQTSSTFYLQTEKSNPQILFQYYFGPFVQPENDDPFKTELIKKRGGKYYLDLSIPSKLNQDSSLLKQLSDKTKLDDDKLEAFLLARYYEAVTPPENLQSLRESYPYTDSTNWFNVELNGVMTTARRSIYISRSDLQTTLSNFIINGGQIIYPEGTVIIGEHYHDGDLAEVTVMRKASQSYWEFFVYGPDGNLTPATSTGPRPLKVPVQCVGCHTGSRLFEPEKSFPGLAPPGPEGKRHIYVDKPLRNEIITAFFNEHRRRNDAVLGIYITLYVATLLEQSRAGQPLALEDKVILDQLEIEHE